VCLGWGANLAPRMVREETGLLPSNEAGFSEAAMADKAKKLSPQVTATRAGGQHWRYMFRKKTKKQQGL